MLHERLKSKKPGERKLFPSALLSDDAGLQMWRDVIHLQNYYATREEVRLLSSYGSRIASSLEPDSVIIDLGCGDVTKVVPILDSLEKERKDVFYFALDLSRPSVEQNMAQLTGRSYQHVRWFGLHGTFEDGLAWSQSIQAPRWFLSLGSIFGNDAFDDAVALLRNWASRMRPTDRLLLGIDAETDRQKIWDSYNDPGGVFHRFLRNAFVHSNRVLGYPWYRDEDWSVASIVSGDDTVIHQYIFTALRDVECPPLSVCFPAGDKIDFYESYKWGEAKMGAMFSASGFDAVETWNLPDGPVYEYLLRRAS